ncbi:membrane protein [Iodidimonas gelatinilytica]|uniref:Membrane protein n=1 Tax=Iodidimonas gelatinilytica TaxID=1236966 RepID=A0A5A7N3N1_9PROT|nr:MAPEG family protein [Iodidimonas gelatinilytica]GER01646.1 membrane protein [Iodidimonas gelatinilytica]
MDNPAAFTLPLSAELYWLLLTCLLTAFLWLPYILQLLMEQGTVKALMDGQHAAPAAAPWAQRAKRAHLNAVENLAVFAPLVLLVALTGNSSGVTILAAQIYFFARLGHYLVYLMGLPVVRTIFFAIGFICQLVLAIALL